MYRGLVYPALDFPHIMGEIREAPAKLTASPVRDAVLDRDSPGILGQPSGLPHRSK